MHKKSENVRFTLSWREKTTYWPPSSEFFLVLFSDDYTYLILWKYQSPFQEVWRKVLQNQPPWSYDASFDWDTRPCSEIFLQFLVITPRMPPTSHQTFPDYGTSQGLASTIWLLRQSLTSRRSWLDVSMILRTVPINYSIIIWIESHPWFR